jgi:secretion/DNA translocation related TadE-like protein
VNDDGVVSVLMLSLLALAALLCLAVADAANVLLSRARAQSAADAAALAAAAVQWRVSASTGDPAVRAQEIAEANGAQLESCVCELRDDAAVVTVSIPTRIRMLGVAPSRVTATATARVDVGRMFEAPS